MEISDFVSLQGASMAVMPVGDECWMTVNDFKVLESAVRSIDFEVSFMGPTYWERIWKPVVKKFCRIVFPNLLELANVDERALNPLASKKLEMFTGK